MRKRILSLLLAFLMAFSMIPAQAFATDSTEITETPTETTSSACPTCGELDCISGHENWCDICRIDNCGKEHKQCETCGTIDCTKEHKSCEICSVIDCTADHTNWCDICKFDNCGKDHGAPVATVEVEDAPGCCTFQNGVHDATCVNYTCPQCGTGPWHETCPVVDEPHPMEGKLVQFIKEYPTLWDRPDGTESLANKKLLPSVMRVVKVETDSKNRTLYLLETVEGTWDSFYEGYYYADSTQMEEIVVKEPCPVCGETDCTTEHKQCEICGEYDCIKLHFFCEYCQNYTCTQAHLICPACGEVDCETAHIWCGICADYDCGVIHENESKPNTAPVIPNDPTMTPGEDVSIVDEYGDAVTEDGLYLAPGMRTSLSAWDDQEDADAAYQWQIRYDDANDLWVDIQGQTGKGILVSPAMFLSIIEESGSAAIRCCVTSGGETKVSATIPVAVAGQQMMASYGLRSDSVPLAEGEDSTGEDLQKSYVVVQYVYADGRTAASSDFAEVIPGTAIDYNYTLPKIVGYKPVLKNASTLGNHAAITDGELTVTYAQGELEAGKYAQITVEYQPDFVNVTVIHYWQNVDNDNYVEHERETVSNKYNTGDVIADAHKSYPGFYNLLYETPAAAADGSTVIEVYYDRYYYLMNFDLGGGYGVDAVYARYGAPISENPNNAVRPGYTFIHWTLNGNVEPVAKTMPAANVTYVAVWAAQDTAKVTVVFWGENPDDTGYSYVKTGTLNAQVGSQFTFTDGTQVLQICGKDAHSHGPDCDIICGKEEHTIHTEDCLGCGHVCTLDCYSAGNYGLIEAEKPDDLEATSQDGIYTYETGSWWNSTTHYYLYLGGQWYCAKNRWDNKDDDTEITYNCDHSHSNSCYSCEYHEHNSACYSCGMVEHTHDNTCSQTGSGMDSSLWTFLSSESPTVSADGTTVVNVKYTRKTRTMHFRKSRSSSDDYGTIVAKWGANIEDEFEAICELAGGQSWSEENPADFPLTNHLVIMPKTNKIYYHYTGSGSKLWVMTYYRESLTEGEYEVAFTVELKRSGTTYVSEEEYIELEGFIINHDRSTDVEEPTNGAVFFYDRHKYNIEFYNPTTQIRKTENVPYQAPLGAYYWEPDQTQAPIIYEPGSVRFAGWYLNPECTGTMYDFSAATSTMPAGEKDGDTTLTFYAKWEPVEYKINYYLSLDSLNRGENIPKEMNRLVDAALDAGTVTERPEDVYTTLFAEAIVKHNAFISNPADPGVAEGYDKIHPYTGYDFIGWFYLNEDGEETAFDPENMPVKQDLNLYAKWSSNTLCYYNVYFALDVKNNKTGEEGSDGIADVDADGNVIYIADPISGSAIAGRTYTFTAKGGEELYNLGEGQNYREGYFPTAGSHSITIDIADTDGTGANSYTFLYQQKTAVPYIVKYVVKETGETLFPDKVVADNKNVVVTENFQYKQGYMPDEYQITLIVTDDGNPENDVIIFYYTKDEQHALYIVNYYIQDLDENLNHKGWSKYDDMQSTGTIGTTYSADAITIDGFTLSQFYTDDYNRANDPINGMTGTALPTKPISALTNGKLSGTLSDKGMELNFYYTRNLYPYEFRYMLNGTTTQLAEPAFGKAGYDTYVKGVAQEIKMDLDGDGFYEDYRLYDPTETTKDIHIIKDGDPLDSDDVVTKGQATVNVATFYYVRCTQTMTITKEVVDEGESSDPNPDQEFNLSLLIHAKNGYHRTEYTYKITEGENEVSSGTLSPVPAAPNTLQFTLKAGQKITIEGLPTAEYTVSERNLPTGYYDTAGTNVKNKLTVDGQLDVTVTNTYDPALLSITKTVDVVEENGNIPEIQAFEFTITVPNGVIGSYDYTIGTVVHTATVSNGSMTIMLENGQTATFQNLPVGNYAVTETDYSAYGYDSSYQVNAPASYTEGQTATITTVQGATQTVEFLNKFPVGDLTIHKTVSKEFYGTEWNGDMFTFTVERTTTDRPLKDGNKYDVYEGETRVGTVTVENGKLIVMVTFGAEDAAALDEASEQDASVPRTLVIKNLPAGTYSVEENEDSAYVQTPNGLKVDNLTIPAEEVTAYFANTVKRGVGSLSLEKELEVLEGYQKPPEVTMFSFAIELMECVPAEESSVTVTYTPAEYTDGEATATSVTMSGGKFTVTLEAGQKVLIQNLPEGKYSITEATIPYYANAFAHKENGSWIVQPSTTTTDGQMYTEIGVANGKTSEVKCTNTYPVDKAELIIQKVVTKEYERDTLQDISFTFTVTLAEDDVSSYAYKIYNTDGTLAKEDTASVENKRFSVELKAGQYAVIPGMPVCGYTVSENVDTTDYNASYTVYVYETGEAASTSVNTSGAVNASGTGASVSRTFSAGKTDAIVFTNEYKRHLGTLTISKNVSGSSEDSVFIFHIKGTDENNSYIDMDISIEGSGSITIYDLPLGTYTVAEDTSWSWRYTADVATHIVNLTDDPDAEVEYTNNHEESRWLNHLTNLPNTFSKKKEENEGS